MHRQSYVLPENNALKDVVHIPRNYEKKASVAKLSLSAAYILLFTVECIY